MLLKMMPTDMFDTGCHNFQFVKKKKKNYLSSAIRLSTVKQGVSTLQNQCCNRSPHITAFISGEETSKVYSLSNSQVHNTVF